MSAPILQRGDRIHLAFPISPMLSGTEREAKMAGDAEAFVREFERQGVTVTSWTAHSSLTHPVIVAVFRSEPGHDGQGKP